MARWIKNFDKIATTSNRKMALEIMEAGLEAIETKKVIESSVSLVGNILFVQGKSFNLAKFEKIKVVGFGKASAEAAEALEKILGSRIAQGTVIGLQQGKCEYIETFAGTHPIPDKINVEASKKIYEMARDSNEKDLVIVLVSGGGSSLLCYPDSECDQSQRLYSSFLKSGKTITEINTVRKHLSLMKGGGLAKLAYPATVVGLIFSDIPGDHFENVASGPTYWDKTTVADAEKIITENDLGKFNLMETPKEDKYFDNVHNFVLVSNKVAVGAMQKRAEVLGLDVKFASDELYDVPEKVLEKIFSLQKSGSAVLAAGEPSIEIQGKGGKGGRNLHLGLSAIQSGFLDENSVFISFASDGLDNGDMAGAIADRETMRKAEKLGLDAGEYLKNFDSYDFFQKTGDLILTGPTGTNVSDLMILLTKNEQ